MFPVYLHYRGIQFLNRDLKVMSDAKADELYNECHSKYADDMRDLTFRLRGFYLKQAQLMSMQDDFVPPAYMKWMKLTQDNVPSEFKDGEAKEYVRLICKQELGLDFDCVFSEWDDFPLGVASIGQVHRAVLRGGQQVAVKLLVPGIEEKFRSDIKTAKLFCQLAMPQHVPSFEEIEKQFLTEFNYAKEAQNLQLLGDCTRARWGDTIVIPKPFMEFCSKHLLVMEFLEGERLVDGIRNRYRKFAPLIGKTIDELEAEMAQKIQSSTFEYKSIEEEKAQQRQAKLALVIKDIYEKNAWRFVHNWTPLAWVYGRVPYQWTELPIDLGSTLELLARVQAENIFFDGAFNGDAHPGNILLLKDGRIGLIDYGQVKTMSVAERIIYAKLIIAHSRRDRDEVVRLSFDELGIVTKYKRKDIAYLHSAFWNDRITKDVMGEMNLASFIDYMEAQDPIVYLPNQYLMAARSSLMLRGLGKAFGINLIMSNLWKQYAVEFLDSQGVSY